MSEKMGRNGKSNQGKRPIKRTSPMRVLDGDKIYTFENGGLHRERAVL